MTEQVIDGLAELNKAFEQLAPNIERNWLRGALRAGAKVQLAEAQRDVPVGDPSSEGRQLYRLYRGALRDSLRISTRVRGGDVVARVTAGGKSKKTGADVFYAIMVEKGTTAHEIKPKAHRSLFFAGLMRQLVQHPGAKKEPFMGPALRNTVQASVAAFAAYLRARFEKADIAVPGPENY